MTSYRDAGVDLGAAAAEGLEGERRALSLSGGDPSPRRRRASRQDRGDEILRVICLEVTIVDASFATPLDGERARQVSVRIPAHAEIGHGLGQDDVLT